MPNGWPIGFKKPKGRFPWMERFLEEAQSKAFMEEYGYPAMRIAKQEQEAAEKAAPWWQKALQPLTRVMEPMERAGRGVGMAVTAPFVPEQEKAMGEVYGFPEAAGLPKAERYTPEMKAKYEEYLVGAPERAAIAEEIYEERVPAPVRFVAEELVYLPLWFGVIGGVSKLGMATLKMYGRRAAALTIKAAGQELTPKLAQELSTAILKRAEAGLTKAMLGKLPTAAERRAMQALHQARTGTTIKVETLLKEAQGMVKAAPKSPLVAKELVPAAALSAKEAIEVMGKLTGPLWKKLPTGERAMLAEEANLPRVAGARAWRALSQGDQSKLAQAWITRGQLRVPSPPPEADPLVTKMAAFIDGLKPTMREAEVVRHRALAQKLTQARTAHEIDDVDKMYAAWRRAMHGEIAKPEAPISDIILTTEEIKYLKSVIHTTDRLPPISVDAAVRGRLIGALDNLLTHGKLPQPQELADLEKVFGSGFAKAILKKRGLPRKIWEVSLDAMMIPKSIRASWDISAVYRQGAFLLTDRPLQIPGAIKTQLRAIVSDKGAFLTHEACHATTWEVTMNQAGLYRPDFWATVTKLSTREEAYMSRMARLAPGIKRSERAYIVGLNKIRTDFFIYQAEQWQRMGVKATEADHAALARAINILTGRGEIGGPGGIADAFAALNTVMFSPRFQLSRIQSPLLLFDRRNPLIQKMSARVLMKYYGFWATMLGAGKMAGIETDFDPRSTNFGKFRVDNTWIDVTAGGGPWLRYAARVLSGTKTKSAYTGVVRDTNLQNLTWTFGRTKLNPAITPLIDWESGSTLVGKELEDMTPVEHLIEYWSPLALQAVVEAAQEEGFVGGLKALPEFIGFGVYTIPTAELLQSEVSARYQDYLALREEERDLEEEGDWDKLSEFYQVHPEMVYGIEYGRANRLIDDIRDQIQAVKKDQTLSSQARKAKLEELSQLIIDYAVAVLEMDNAIAESMK